MTSEPAPARLPFRRLLLMPWWWSRWVLFALPFSALLAYFLSGALFFHLLIRGKVPASLVDPLIIFTRPISTGVDHAPPLRMLYQWESRLIYLVLGPVGWSGEGDRLTGVSRSGLSFSVYFEFSEKDRRRISQ
jgi:hypothetical protein